MKGMVLAFWLAAACATGRVDSLGEPSEQDGPLITREDIEGSGARNGWEALRLGLTHLNYQYTRQGSDVRVTHRGVSSFLIDPQVLLVVDGTHMQSLSVLETIPAENINYIQILSARVGVVKYGTGAGNGVVVVKTGVPPPKAP
jgi:hypothetical protein